MTKEELIGLGKKNLNCEGTEEELDRMMDIFDKNVPYPTASSLFYWLENYNARRDDISKYNPTVEEVVDKALGYKPTELRGSSLTNSDEEKKS